MVNLASNISGKSKLYGIIGNPVDESKSPYMHNAAFAHENIQGIYVPFHIENQEAPDFAKLLSSFSFAGVQGFNITAPFKQQIIPFLDRLMPMAKASNSVNTVAYKEQKWIGESTDGPGFVKAIESEGWNRKGESALVIGAGGAASSIIPALAEAGFASVIIKNIDEAQAVTIQERVKQYYPHVKVLVNPSEVPAYSYLINTTPVGWHDANLSATQEEIEKATYVIDVIYHVKTPLLQLAEKLGKQTQSGMEMLLYQGIIAFEIWTGITPPLEVMRQALLQAK